MNNEGQQIKRYVMQGPCPKCFGVVDVGCSRCRGQGWIIKCSWEAGPDGPILNYPNCTLRPDFRLCFEGQMPELGR